MNRRNFVGRAATGLSALAVPASGWATASLPEAAPTCPANDRAYWLATLLRVVEPVLANAAAGRLKATMPIEAAPSQQDGRRAVTHLEALGRTLADFKGPAVFLASPASDYVHGTILTVDGGWMGR